VAQLRRRWPRAGSTSERLTRDYIQRILDLDQVTGSELGDRAQPDAISMARDADANAAARHRPRPLHGIPVLLKDNIDTGDRMQTTAGSSRSWGPPPGAIPRLRPSCAPAER